MTRLDLWYDNNPSDIDRISITFNDHDCTYRGNLYSGGRIIGDYTATDSIELEKRFPEFRFNWG